MSNVDCQNQLEDAVVAHLEARLSGVVKRVLTADDVGPDRPVPARFMPCLVVGLGAEMPVETGAANEGGFDRLVATGQQVDVMVATDAGERGFSAKVRTLANQVRAAMAEFAATTPLAIDDLSWAGTTPHDLASEKGLAGGALVAFRAVYLVREGTPGTFEPNNRSSF